jgi:hypothetical protein
MKDGQPDGSDGSANQRDGEATRHHEDSRLTSPMWGEQGLPHTGLGGQPPVPQLASGLGPAPGCWPAGLGRRMSMEGTGSSREAYL